MFLIIGPFTIRCKGLVLPLARIETCVHFEKGASMARSKSSRKYQLTINNPEIHGYTHSHIWEILEQFPSLVYCCMCDEIGENKTPHTHVYTVFRNGVMFDTLHETFLRRTH
ncbi:hypothetical protein H8717_12750 [Oscillospiraceae bacterium BX1]|uniref:CRESS-DNA virus Rep endonuclease domain-containing protein n=1 Tax=Yanshouia hominis TaxID=2763673 RepID=A0ABR7NNQ5_9FIRM|nr:hypothetical protein [Yanshouia hominis]